MHSSVVMEGELYAMAAPGVSIHTSRLRLPKVTVSELSRMMESPELETAVRLVGGAPIDVLCFGGTSAAFLHGRAGDESLIRRIRGWLPDVPTTTAARSVVEALGELNAGPVALATPYRKEVNERAIRYLGEHGHEVVNDVCLGITDDHELAKVPLQAVFDLACRADSPRAEAVFISCTNLRTVGVIAALEEELRKPVVSAVSASYWHCLTLVGAHGARGGYGRLLDAVADGSAPLPSTRAGA
jgi:maleate isomerase